MKKLLLALTLALAPLPAWAQCTGIFGASQVCGSVAGGPPTAISTASSFPTQAANLFFAGPSSGAAATPTFRAIGGNDLVSPPAIGGTTPNTIVASDFTVLGTGDTLYPGLPNGSRTTIINGTTSAPVTALNAPSMLISRVEALPSAGGNQSSALYVFDLGTAGSNSQTQAITAYAQSNGPADAVAMFGEAQQAVAGHFAYGSYFQANALTLNSFAIANEVQVNNSTGADQAYAYNTIAGITGEHIFTLGANKATAGVWVGQIGGATTFDVGMLFSPSSIATATIQDDSSSATILRATGSHTTGIDMSGATVSGNILVGPSGTFYITASGGILGTTTSTLSQTLLGETGIGWNIVNTATDGGLTDSKAYVHLKSNNWTNADWYVDTGDFDADGSRGTSLNFGNNALSTLIHFTASGGIAVNSTVDPGAGGIKASNLTLNSLAFSATAPTVASGFCSTGSPVTALSASNGTAAFDILIGAATCGSTGTLTMPAATTGWVCNATDVTTPASHNVVQTGTQGSTTAVVLTDYARTTGIAQNFLPADHIHVQCTGY